MNALPSCGYYYSNERDPQEEILGKISREEQPSKPQKILLVVPPSPQVPTPGREFLVTGPFEGFTCIATLLKRMGYGLNVVDCRLKDDPIALVAAAAASADIIGIATYCDSFVFLEEATARLKELFPEKVIFLGGPLVTSLPELILTHTHADCAVLGEGELTLIEFLDICFTRGIRGLGQVKGLAFKEEGRVTVNAPRPQIKDLDNLPLADYTIWPNYESIVANGQILISSMRGCPQECSFCFKTIPALRFKSLERFDEEVSFLKRTTGFDYTWLNDLTFNVVEKRAIDVCGILKKHGVRYHCFARVKNVSHKLVTALKDSGCLGIWFGIESYDQAILDANRKNITVKDIDSAVAIAQEAGLAVRGLFIVGLYGETEESLRKMLGFIEKNDFLPLVKYLVPFPGTSLYHHAVAVGAVTDIPGFLRMLSTRKVSDHDDEIVNLTGLDEKVLRDYFHRVWAITKEREKECRYGQ